MIRRLLAAIPWPRMNWPAVVHAIAPWLVTRERRKCRRCGGDLTYFVIRFAPVPCVECNPCSTMYDGGSIYTYRWTLKRGGEA